MQMPHPLTRDLVLIGGGHTHALVLRKWAMAPLAGARVSVINPAPTAPYSGMLPGHIAGHYAREDLDIDLVRLARAAGARVILERAVGLDAIKRQVTLASGRVLEYDIASLDIGITAEMPAIPGFADHALGAKPLDSYAARWRAFLEDLHLGKVQPRVAVIGAGVAGVELAMAMSHALRQAGATPQVHLIEAAEGLTGTGRATGARLLRALRDNGVTLHVGASVARIVAGAVQLVDGRQIAADLIVGAAGAFAHRWLRDTGLPLTDDGFVIVAPDLRVRGVETLFATGDCAHIAHAPRPKAGVFAVRAAPVLYDNLRAALTGQATRPFHPQRDYLKLISLGDKSAVAEKFGLAFSGPWLWRWKDRIDQAFMDKFRTLPAMPAAARPALQALGAPEAPGNDQPLCGGCGSKLGADALHKVLSQLPAPQRADILSLPGDDAAVLATGGVRQVMTTDHLRAFTDDPALMARITAVHALGDIWSMGGTPQAATATVILPPMAPALQARTMAEVMKAASAVFRAAGADIVGGHSTTGAELTLGFTVTGICEGEAITHAGARPGDMLILTRPIGSGTILAAEMQMRANGRHVAALLSQMAELQADAAQVLRGAHAMTDVTGFGLAGHLMALCRASGLAAEISLGDIPVYDGAEALAEEGIRSTAWPANLASAPVTAAKGARGVLLHDPQTAGGLLAAVASDQAQALLEQVKALGHEAAIIGRMIAGAPAISCV
ncbi:MAG: selenide, water dikinase SelD [Rhodobacterales bacterium]|nr:selenide, water dikinase SelD [Rhodobacterales bacterium]MDX5390409.1 selenide, water dikinase SelD [Rhodobacterales bacterium]MDX5490097.1 selenide, water dikinase SelD [Rhodobacterales bacterium]